jgi:hypothetical protein
MYQRSFCLLNVNGNSYLAINSVHKLTQHTASTSQANTNHTSHTAKTNNPVSFARWASQPVFFQCTPSFLTVPISISVMLPLHPLNAKYQTQSRRKQTVSSRDRHTDQMQNFVREGLRRKVWGIQNRKRKKENASISIREISNAAAPWVCTFYEER